MTVQRARIRWNGAAVRGRTREGAVRGLLLGAEHLLAASRAEVPLDEGTLERSGAASVDESSLTAAVSYDTPYAVRVHEDMTARHSPGRKAKYLENPARREAGQIAAIIAAQVRRALRA
ncbi:hypothetical protein ACGH2B_12495 [Streptomyces sp. BBFR2]|uniref:hypothetical protein n=1 Tax=Streptomyces sp. BBFR2 TaxID=3372854 RepID=UPI0037DA4E79